MQSWSIGEIRLLVQQVTALGDCFVVRRTLELLDREDITIETAIERLSSARRTHDPRTTDSPAR